MLGETIPISINTSLYNPNSNLAIEVYGANGAFKFYGPEVGGATGRTINTSSPSFASGTEHLVKIYDINDPSKFDWSDNTFSVLRESAQFIYPSGGESLQLSNSYQIDWNIIGNYSSYDLILQYQGVELFKILRD